MLFNATNFEFASPWNCFSIDTIYLVSHIRKKNNISNNKLLGEVLVKLKNFNNFRKEKINFTWVMQYIVEIVVEISVNHWYYLTTSKSSLKENLNFEHICLKITICRTYCIYEELSIHAGYSRYVHINISVQNTHTLSLFNLAVITVSHFIVNQGHSLKFINSLLIFVPLRLHCLNKFFTRFL